MPRGRVLIQGREARNGLPCEVGKYIIRVGKCEKARGVQTALEIGLKGREVNR